MLGWHDLCHGLITTLNIGQLMTNSHMMSLSMPLCAEAKHTTRYGEITL